MSLPERGVTPEPTTDPVYASQISKVKEHLEAGNSISQLQAYSLVQSTRLSAIIYELRYVNNMDILSVWNYSGGGEGSRRKRYAIYVLREFYNPNIHGSDIFFPQQRNQ